MSNRHPDEQSSGQWANAMTSRPYEEWSQGSTQHDRQLSGATHLPDSINQSHDPDMDPMKLQKWSTRPGDHVEHIGEHGDAGGAPLDTKTTTSSSQRLQFTRSRLLGLHPHAPIAEEHDATPYSNLWWSKVRLALREPFAEFFGVMILVLFGDGAVAQVVLGTGDQTAPGGNGYGGYQSITWGWAIGVMLGVYVAGDSGAYLNPAITFTNCLLRKLPWRRFPVLFGSIPRRSGCCRHNLRQLCQRYQCIRRSWYPNSTSEPDGDSRNILHIPEVVYDQDQHVLFRVCRQCYSHVCDFRPQG